jgi:hypothetical protein
MQLIYIDSMIVLNIIHVLEHHYSTFLIVFLLCWILNWLYFGNIGHFFMHRCHFIIRILLLCNIRLTWFLSLHISSVFTRLFASLISHQLLLRSEFGISRCRSMMFILRFFAKLLEMLLGWVIWVKVKVIIFVFIALHKLFISIYQFYTN